MATDTKQFVDAMLSLIENASHRKLRFTSSVIRGGDVTSIEDYLCELIDGRVNNDPQVRELVAAAKSVLDEIDQHPTLLPQTIGLRAALRLFEEAPQCP